MSAVVPLGRPADGADATPTPASEAEVAAIVRDAAARGEPLALEGAGTRAGLGRPVQARASLRLNGLTGVTLYEPAEMVIGARAGTPVAELQAALAEKGQALLFEPPDPRPLHGTAGEPTIGGLVATNASGPRRLTAGALRDHLIGVRFVNGRGEVLRAGGRVMKNVTGLDLVKLQAGAHGTLGVLTEAIFKVGPKPEAEASLVYEGLGFADAVRLMSAALGTPFEVTCAAFLPAENGAPSRVALRLETMSAFLPYRLDRVTDALRPHTPAAPTRLDAEASAALWSDVRDADALSAGPGGPEANPPVWRVSVPPSRAPAALEAAERGGLRLALADWGGGLLWLAAPAGAADGGQAAARAASRSGGGHATLARAPAALRAALDVFEPEPAPLAALSARIKASLDPRGVLNPGRLRAGL